MFGGCFRDVLGMFWGCFGDVLVGVLGLFIKIFSFLLETKGRHIEFLHRLVSGPWINFLHPCSIITLDLTLI